MFVEIYTIRLRSKERIKSSCLATSRELNPGLLDGKAVPITTSIDMDYCLLALANRGSLAYLNENRITPEEDSPNLILKSTNQLKIICDLVK